MSLMELNQFAGRFLRLKVDRQVRESGAQQAARNLRKQGVPLSLALLLIVGRV